MNLEIVCEIPRELEEGRNKRSQEKINFTLNIEIELKDDIVRLNMKCLNNIKEHKFSLLFNTDIKSKVAVADTPFGFIYREKNEDILKDWKKYTEYPINIEPLQNSISHFDDKKCFTIYTKGIKEYQLHESGVEITLFRSVGYIGKNDLYFRPGRASGRVNESPEGQLLKNLSFEIAFTSQIKFSELETAIKAEKYLNDFQIYQKQNIEKEIQRIDNFDIWIKPYNFKYEQNIINFEINKNMIFSSIDIRKDSDLLRVFNPTEKTITINSTFQKNICNALGTSIKKDMIKSYDHINIKL